MSGRGRPEYQPNEEHREMIQKLACVCTQEQIALVIGISVETLTKYYRHELDTALLKANAAVAYSLFVEATVNRNVVAAIFWLKTRGGWKTDEQPKEVKEPTKLTLIRGDTRKSKRIAQKEDATGTD